MFLSSAKSVNADKEYCCHSCLCDCERLCGNRVILKELYSTSVEYSTNLLDTIQLDGAEYRIYVFLVNKKFGETCSHNWKLEKRTEATMPVIRVREICLQYLQ